MRILVVAGLFVATPVWAQSVSVTVGAPPPPRVVVSAPAPAPPPRVVVAPPPAIRFEAPPPLVVVEPGVQVVEDNDSEIFFVDGYYWHHAPNGYWYRTRDYRGGWVAVQPRYVPGRIVRLPPGHYRHWRAERRMEHEIRKDERREARDERREVRDEHRAEKAERKWEKHNGRH